MGWKMSYLHEKTSCVQDNIIDKTGEEIVPLKLTKKIRPCSNTSGLMFAVLPVWTFFCLRHACIFTFYRNHTEHVFPLSKIRLLS